MNDNINIMSEEELTTVNGGASYSGPVFKYVIKKGDCLSVLAQKYGTTVKILQELNGIKNPDLIYAGETLLIPYTGSFGK